MVTGAFNEADLGVACYHSKIGAVELCLNHLVDGPGEYVVVDMTAGADAFASGMFTRFDMTFLVAEPTRRGVGVYRQYAGHAAGHGVRAAGAGQQGRRRRGRDYLAAEVGDALLGCLAPSPWVRAARARRRRTDRPARAGEPRRARDPPGRAGRPRARLGAYHAETVDFHLRNAAAWATARPEPTSPRRSTPSSCRAPSTGPDPPTTQEEIVSLDVPTARPRRRRRAASSTTASFVTGRPRLAAVRLAGRRRSRGRPRCAPGYLVRRARGTAAVRA